MVDAENASSIITVHDLTTLQGEGHDPFVPYNEALSLEFSDFVISNHIFCEIMTPFQNQIKNLI